MHYFGVMMTFAIKWKYEHFVQNRVQTKLFAQRYKNFDFAKKIADNTFLEHSIGGNLIARVYSEVVHTNNKDDRTNNKILQTDLFDTAA
jgi:hypothetical protein